MPNRIFGEIPSYPEGTCFGSRLELSRAGVHRPNQAGISGSEKEGADSIVLSGGYEDDRDLGHEIVYTGHGGRDPETGEQVEHQELTRGNMALVLSMREGLPVRVIRGSEHKSPFSPKVGYRYDGLYMVEDYWQEAGKSGFNVWRYRLRKVSDKPISSQPNPESKSGNTADAHPSAARPKTKQTPKTARAASTSSGWPASVPTIMPAWTAQPTPPALKIGDKVRHRIFGEGSVLEIAPSGTDQIVKVQFDAAGEKRFMAGVAKLEKV